MMGKGVSTIFSLKMIQNLFLRTQLLPNILDSTTGITLVYLLPHSKYSVKLLQRRSLQVVDVSFKYCRVSKYHLFCRTPRHCTEATYPLLSKAVQCSVQCTVTRQCKNLRILNPLSVQSRCRFVLLNFFSIVKNFNIALIQFVHHLW